MNDIWLYCLGYAAQKFVMSLHLSRLVLTHHHTDVTPSSNNLPQFAHQIHLDFSYGLNELLAARGYDRPGSIWDTRGPHYLRLVDAAAQMTHFTYDHVNQVAAGLVERPEHMPGSQLVYGHWASDGLVIKRPFMFGKDRPREILVSAEPSPELMLAFGGDRQAAIHHMEKMGRDAVREIRAARKRPALGAQKLKRLHPYDEPRSEATRGRPVPTFRIGTRDEVGEQQRAAAQAETRGFRQTHAEVRQARLAGQADSFPFGTYGQRVYHGAPVDEPSPDALLAHPAPLLHEVLESLENGTAEPVNRDAAIAEARQNITEHAAAVVEENDLDFRRANPDEPVPEGERPPLETRHKNAPKGTWPVNPRRLSFRRDKRLGRPRKKPGSDPPVE